jgi:hypothetical protein
MSDAGFIFFVNHATQDECLLSGLGGLPAGSRALAESVARGSAVFVYNTSSKVMHGPFEAERNGGWQLQPRAFDGRFPAQVLFRVRRGRVAVALPLAAVSHALIFFAGNKFKQRLTAEQARACLPWLLVSRRLTTLFCSQVAALHAAFDAGGLAGGPERRSGPRSPLRVVRVEERAPASDEASARRPASAERPRSSPRRERAVLPAAPSPERASSRERREKRPADAPNAEVGGGARPRLTDRSPQRAAEPQRHPSSHAMAPPMARIDRSGGAPLPPPCSKTSAFTALNEFVPLPRGSPPPELHSPTRASPPRATQLAVRPVFAGSIKPVLLLGEAPASAPAPQPSGAADSYRASMLREAMPPVRAEMVTIQAMASGDERARATRRLLAKYHPSQAGAVVQNPALQWLFSEITKEISQSLSNLR